MKRARGLVEVATMMGINSVRFFFLPLILAAGLLLGSIVGPDDRPTQSVPTFSQGVSSVPLPEPIDGMSAYFSRAQPRQDEQPREPLFVGWQVPQAALFFSGRQNGYIEPCGCTGLENQLGGMMRRHTLINQLRGQGWNVLGIDTGNQVRRFGPQANLKIATTYQCFGEDLKYSAIGFGPDDLRLPTIELMQVMSNSGLASEAFVSANVTIFDASFTSRYRVFDAGGKKIGVTMVLGDEQIASLPEMSDVTTMPVDQALREVLPLMRQENCDVKVLVAYMSLEKSRELARAWPHFDVLVTCGVDGEPTMLPEDIRDPNSTHVTQMIQVGIKGMHVGVVGLFDKDGTTEIRYQRVPLDARFEDSEAIKEKFFSYQKQIESLGLDGLGLRAVQHPSGYKYVGSESCYDCHDAAYDIWKDGIDGNGGPHFRATSDLTQPGERTWVQRHHDPECLSCHVTGWNAQDFFPYQSGYLKLEDSLMHGNGCENCHGPGSMHVAAENGDIDVTEEQRVGYVREMVVTLKQAREEMCATCHDLDNSPGFHEEGAFEKYWEKIRHDED